MSPDFYKALEISGIGIAGVFIFMTVFYFVIMGLDKFFPQREKNKTDCRSTETGIQTGGIQR